MKECLKHISWYLIIILGAMFGVEYCTNKALKEDNERLKNNQISLTKDIEGYRLKDSSFVAQIETLSISKDEFMQVCSEQAEEIKALNITLKRLQNVTNSKITHEYSFDSIPLRSFSVDTSFLRSFSLKENEPKEAFFFAQKEPKIQRTRTDRTDSLRCFEYADSWIRFSGCVADSFLSGVNIQTYDTITSAVSKEYRKKFLFFHWKPYYKVTLHSKNPYSKITSAQYVEIK